VLWHVRDCVRPGARRPSRRGRVEPRVGRRRPDADLEIRRRTPGAECRRNQGRADSHACADVGEDLTAVRMLLLLVLLPIASCADLRVQEGIFTNLDEARAAGAVASGWIPDGLPASAADLREGHMPDGRHWGVFIFAPHDAAVVRALLGPEIVT